MEFRGTVGESWWVLALLGLFSIIFGLAALFWPGLTLVVAVWVYGIYAIVYGVVELINMFRAMGQHATWWTHLVIGLISLGAGLVVIAWPMISSVILLYVIAFWAIGIGIFEVFDGLFHTGLAMVVVGVVSLLFGILLLANPLAGALALMFVIGIFSLVRGVLLLIAAIRAPSPTQAA